MAETLRRQICNVSLEIAELKGSDDEDQNDTANVCFSHCGM